jgi:hypothetical protein
MSRRLLTEIVPQDWDSQTPAAGSGTGRVRFLQDVDDLVNRPLNNRLIASGAPAAVTLANDVAPLAAASAIQSTGIGVGPIQPRRYAEFTVKGRVSYSVSGDGQAYVYVYRTLGAIPANGAQPNAGDVIVGEDAFTGGAAGAGVNQVGAFSFLDTGLDASKAYRYYFAVQGPTGQTIALASSSQLVVMERS